VDAGEGGIEQRELRLSPGQGELQAELEEGLDRVGRGGLGEVDAGEGRPRRLEPALALEAPADLADDLPAERRLADAADAADADKEQGPASGHRQGCQP